METRDLKKWVQNPRRQRAIAVREQVEAQTRFFFKQNGYRETRTPLLVTSPGMEPHIRPFQVASHGRKLENALFLPTSPEFAMKKLLVGGLEKIFQICPAFRDEPFSPTHRPEFTMLEWYHAGGTTATLMQEIENWFAHLAQALFSKPEITFQKQVLSLETPWPRFTPRELFLKHLDLDLSCDREALARVCKSHGHSVSGEDTWDDLYFKLWLNHIEPKLPSDRPCFIHQYPASQAALAEVVKGSDGYAYADRFEFYAGGFELGNAFQELTDPKAQRARFEKDMEYRAHAYGADFPKSPVDEEFLTALEQGLPRSAGIAVGLDRVIQLFADETDIQYTFWL